MSKRILYIVESLKRCGVTRQLALLAKGLPRPEFEVHVLALDRGRPVADELQTAGVSVTVLGRRWRWDPRTFLRLRSHIVRLQPQLVQTWQFQANTYGRCAAWTAGAKPLVAVERRLDRWKDWPEWLVDRRLARRTACLVANSVAVRDYYVEHGVSDARWEVVLDAAPPLPLSELSRDQFLEQFDLPPHARAILAVGKLRPENHHKDLIWATDLLKIIDDSVYLLIVGDGPQQARIERFRQCVRIEDRVRLLGRRDDVPQLLPHCAQFWQGSDDLGLPTALLEAMSAGLPIVASDTPAHRTVISHGENGLLAPVGDRAAIAKQALKLLEDAELATSLGEAARRRALQDFSPALTVERYAALYRELIRS